MQNINHGKNIVKVYKYKLDINKNTKNIKTYVKKAWPNRHTQPRDAFYAPASGILTHLRDNFTASFYVIKMS